MRFVTAQKVVNEGSATQRLPGRVYSVAGVFEQTLHCVQGTPWVPQDWTPSVISESPNLNKGYVNRREYVSFQKVGAGTRTYSYFYHELLKDTIILLFGNQFSDDFCA